MCSTRFSIFILMRRDFRSLSVDDVGPEPGASLSGSVGRAPTGGRAPVTPLLSASIADKL